MDKFLEKLNKAKSKVNLSEEKKEDLYLRIISATMDKNRKTLFPAESFWNAYLKRPASVLAGVLGVFILTVGTSFASESSLPGDILYPVKKNVNEAVLKIFADTPEKKAKLAAELIERRVLEAAQLASSGKLNEEISGSLVSEVENISVAAKEQISLLKEGDRLDLAIKEASRLEVSLRAGNRVMKIVSDKKEKYDSAVAADLESKFDTLAISAEVDRSDMENLISPQSQPVAVSMFMAAKSIAPVEVATGTSPEVSDKVFTKELAKDGIEEVSRSLEKLKLSVPKVERNANISEVEVSIKDAEESLNEAKNSLENNDFKNSILFINRSSRKVREVEIINRVEEKLNFEVEKRGIER